MGSVYKKVIGIGISTVLIPLGKWVFNKIVSRGIGKLEVNPLTGGDNQVLLTQQPYKEQSLKYQAQALALFTRRALRRSV